MICYFQCAFFSLLQDWAKQSKSCVQEKTNMDTGNWIQEGSSFNGVFLVSNPTDLAVSWIMILLNTLHLYGYYIMYSFFIALCTLFQAFRLETAVAGMRIEFLFSWSIRCHPGQMYLIAVRLHFVRTSNHELHREYSLFQTRVSWTKRTGRILLWNIFSCNV